ncbi:MAG: polysaccharide biosynthesis tyrosine autokinase [Candidatus Omnitrophica bacterium]|nr:polysaccharide biosynthesis tyrosine autokinase [Candidatus Omnitrophota bacterium]
MNSTSPNSGAYGSYGFDDVDKPFDYKYYLFLLKKNFYILLTFFVIAGTLSAIYAAKIPDAFVSSAQLIIERPKNLMAEGMTDADLSAQSWSEDYYKTQLEIMTGPTVLRQVITELKLTSYFEQDDEDRLLEDVRKMITVTQVKQSRLFNVQVTAGDANLAANIANAVARAYIRKNFEDSLYYSKELLGWLPESASDAGTVTIEDPFGRVRQISREELIENLPTIQTDPTIRSLKERKNALESELKLLLKQYREKHPKIVKARSTLKFLDESIDAEKKRIVEGLKSKMQGAMQTTQGRVIEEALPADAPIGPNRLKIIVIVALGELFISLLLLFLLDHFDDTIHSMEDLERKGVVLPFLGPVAMVKDKKPNYDDKSLVVFHDRKSEITESFRYLRVAINFSAPPETLKNLIMTSCLPHEGKSFINHNIAASLALDGNKTLLVDCDLRRPVVHKQFKVDNSVGLSNYLTTGVGMESVLKPCYVDNLTLVTSGPVSPNPAEILGSDRMKQFLEEARSRFDRIIIDSPPLTGLGDTFVVGNLVGHVILVVAAARTPSDLIKRIQTQLDKSGIKIMGVVLNQVDMEKERLGGYSKHYYHTYNRYYRRDGGKDD